MLCFDFPLMGLLAVVAGTELPLLVALVEAGLVVVVLPARHQVLVGLAAAEAVLAVALEELAV